MAQKEFLFAGVERRSDVFRFGKPRGGAQSEPNEGEVRGEGDS